MICKVKIFQVTSCLCSTMSKLFKKTVTQRNSNHLPTRMGLVPVEDLGHARVVYGTGHLPPALPGAQIVTRTGVFSHIINADHDDTEGDSTAHHLLDDSLCDVEMSIDNGLGLDDEQSCLEAEKRANKKKKQWANWNELVPLLLRPYVDLLYETDNLRNVATVCGDAVCEGCQHGRLIEIFCVFFNSKFAFLWFYCTYCFGF